jgi:hypothetical protein
MCGLLPCGLRLRRARRKSKGVIRRGDRYASPRPSLSRLFQTLGVWYCAGAALAPGRSRAQVLADMRPYLSSSLSMLAALRWTDLVASRARPCAMRRGASLLHPRSGEGIGMPHRCFSRSRPHRASRWPARARRISAEGRSALVAALLLRHFPRGFSACFVI